LRDLQTVLWIAARRASAAPGASWPKAGLITAQEARGISRQERLIARCACACTISRAAVRTDSCFDLQAALAHEVGLVDTPAKRASEQLMQRYYARRSSSVRPT